MEVYLKSIISFLRKSQAFQELLNDELPVSLPKINNAVGDEKSSVAWLGKDSLALRGNSGRNLFLYVQTQAKENFSSFDILFETWNAWNAETYSPPLSVSAA